MGVLNVFISMNEVSEEIFLYKVLQIQPKLTKLDKGYKGKIKYIQDTSRHNDQQNYSQVEGVDNNLGEEGLPILSSILSFSQIAGGRGGSNKLNWKNKKKSAINVPLQIETRKCIMHTGLKYDIF